MRVFPEDEAIRVFHLIPLWVAEGFLKPINDKSLEEAAEEYLKELIDRNLILVGELCWNGKAKSYKIHDLLRDFCLREAQKQRFLCVPNSKDPNNIPQDINVERRICMEDEDFSQFDHALQSAFLTRSLLLMNGGPGHYDQPLLLSCRLLRVFLSFEEDKQFFTLNEEAAEPIFPPANMRYILMVFEDFISPSSCSIFWNLQTLFLSAASCKYLCVPSKIWELALLRHVGIEKLELKLPDSPCGDDNIVLVNLHTLSAISNSNFSKKMIKRIPNVKTLKLYYSKRTNCRRKNLHRVRMLLRQERDPCLENFDHLMRISLKPLHRLQKLECLHLHIAYEFPEEELDYDVDYYRVCDLVKSLNFPHSLKKLSLSGTMLKWKEFTRKIGSLPLLEDLKLKESSCIGPKWETVEGKFCSLKFLFIGCCGLKNWKMEETHFPRLEHLVLEDLYELEEIPSSVGDIPTLQSIKLKDCSKSAKESAERIKEEQEDNGNVGLKIHIEDYVVGADDSD